MRWLVFGSMLLLVACASGPPEVSSSPVAPTAPAVTPTVPVASPTPIPQATPAVDMVSKPLRISSVGSDFFLAGIITGTIQIDAKQIHVSIDEATRIRRDTSAYTGSVELISIRADLTEYSRGRPVLVINQTDPLPLHKTMRPGERVTVEDLQFNLSRAGAEQLDHYALGFRVDVSDLGGFVVISGPPDTFAGITPPPTIAAEEAKRVRVALARTRQLSTYRLELRHLTHDGTAEGAAGAEGHGELGVNYIAAFDATDAMFTLRGQSLILHGLDPDGGLEVIAVDGRTYAHGPLPLSGASADAWYDMSGDPTPVLQPWYTADTLLDALTVQVEPRLLMPDGVETLDRQRCTIYRAGRLATMVAFLRFAGVPSLQSEQAIERIDQDFIMRAARMSLWVCDDGYLHQLTLDEVLAPETQPDRLVGFAMKVRVTDINGAVLIAAPTQAQPLAPVADASPVALAGTVRAGIPMTASRHATIYAKPNVLSQAIGQVAVGEIVQLLERTDTGVWYRIITEGDATGWIRVVELPVARDIALQVPVASTP
jgi:hypothetical protein